MTKAEPKRRMAEKTDSELVRDLKASADSIEDEDFWPEKILMFQARDRIQELEAQISDYERVLADKRRLAREIDVAMHGEEAAAKQASLCDLVAPAKRLRAQLSGVHAGTHVIVPVEPTEEMVRKGACALGYFTENTDKAVVTYRAMLSATKEKG